MAEKKAADAPESVAAAPAPQPMVIFASPQMEQQRLAAELEQLKKNPLDKTVPGGRYETKPDSGKFVDANGVEVQ